MAMENRKDDFAFLLFGVSGAVEEEGALDLVEFAHIFGLEMVSSVLGFFDQSRESGHEGWG